MWPLLVLCLFCYPFKTVDKQNLVAFVHETKETQVWLLGQEDPLEEGRANYSSILAWRISWTEELGGLQSAAAAAKSLQSYLTLWDPIDGSPLGSSVPGILQARTLEWVAISSSNAWKWKVKVKSLSRARLLAMPWTAAYQAPLSMGFSRQEYWSEVPLPSPKRLALPNLDMINNKFRSILIQLNLTWGSTT